MSSEVHLSRTVESGSCGERDGAPGVKTTESGEPMTAALTSADAVTSVAGHAKQMHEGVTASAQAAATIAFPPAHGTPGGGALLPAAGRRDPGRGHTGVNEENAMSYSAFDLTGKVALVTGGNGGIGLGMAHALAEAGAAVCIWGTHAGKNDRALAELEALGGPAQALPCDVGDRAQVESAFAATLERFGRVDACFVNAGVSGWQRSFLDITPEEWRRVLRVNLDGAFHTLQVAARHMIDRADSGDPGGRLVATGSLAAVSGAARNEHYAATKGGLVSMMRALAVELARHRITANVIQPGWVETAMTQDTFDQERFATAVLPRVPMRRWGQPTDFGGIAVYLASDASAYHTGDAFLIDGGYFLF
jgi:NAD(P)-dependent dehydrogenase (short-subunit alcohol dehydrogenase family)